MEQFIPASPPSEQLWELRRQTEILQRIESMLAQVLETLSDSDDE